MSQELQKMNKNIKTNRLILRKPTIDDAKNMFEYTSNAENIYWTDIICHKSIQDTIDGINNYFLLKSEGK